MDYTRSVNWGSVTLILQMMDLRKMMTLQKSLREKTLSPQTMQDFTEHIYYLVLPYTGHCFPMTRTQLTITQVIDGARCSCLLNIPIVLPNVSSFIHTSPPVEVKACYRVRIAEGNLQNIHIYSSMNEFTQGKSRIRVLNVEKPSQRSPIL